MSDDLEARVARNEATFRLINEDIRRGRDADDDEGVVGFVCECGSIECNRLIELTPAEYERVRGDSCNFAVADGHELEWAEDVVDRTDRYAIVRKLEDVDRIATTTDPRR